MAGDRRSGKGQHAGLTDSDEDAERRREPEIEREAEAEAKAEAKAKAGAEAEARKEGTSEAGRRTDGQTDRQRQTDKLSKMRSLNRARSLNKRMFTNRRFGCGIQFKTLSFLHGWGSRFETPRWRCEGCASGVASRYLAAESRGNSRDSCGTDLAAAGRSYTCGAAGVADRCGSASRQRRRRG